MSGSNTFFVFKFLFYNLNIKEFPPVNKRYTKSTTLLYISSCFESKNHFIFCYSVESSKYTIYVFNYDLVLLNKTLTETYVSSAFYKCVHFTEDVGAFVYMDSAKNFAFQFKEYIPNIIKDYFNSTSKLIISKQANYPFETKPCDLIKLNDKKILLAFTTSDSSNNVFNIFVINNYVDEKLKIRHYVINTYILYLFKIKEDIFLSLYNDLIALGFGGNNGTTTIASLMIFSYPNSTDFSLNITENFISFNNPIIKLYEKCIIENNIFGYIFAGYKIYDFTKGLKLIDLYNQKEIKKNSSLSNNTDIELNITNEVNIEGERIEYGMFITEPEYEIYNEYTTDIDNNYCGGDDNCNDEKDYFSPKLYFGRHSYLDITFDLNIVGKDCNTGCIVCIQDSNRTCLLCQSLFEELPDGKKNCPNYTLPTTLLTTMPISTTELEINTTIPLTEISTIPTTIISNENETTYLNNESTNPNIESTIPNVESSIPNVKSTNPNNQSTYLNLSSTIPNIESTNFNIGSTNPTIESTNPTIESTNLNTEPTELTSPNTEPIESTNPNIESTESENDNIQPINPNIGTTILKTEDNNKNSGKTCTNDEILDNKCTEGRMSVEQIDDIKNTLINKNKANENSIIKTENIIIQLSLVEIQKNLDDPDISNIDLGECENRIKEANNIDDLLIFKTDIKSEDLSATYVAYEIYNPYTLAKLNVSVCDDVQISINVPLKLDRYVEALINSTSEAGYNMFNENDSFYHDICATYTSLNGTDMLLYDRKKDIFDLGQNQTMCQKGCIFEDFNIKTKKAKCNCTANGEEITNLNVKEKFGKKEILDSFYNTITYSNFHVLKCYKLIIQISLIIKNIGEILMTILFIIFIILVIIYLFNGQKQIIKYIDLIIKLKNANNMKNSAGNKPQEEKPKKTNKKKKNSKKKKLKKENNKLSLNKTKKSKKIVKSKFKEINTQEEPPKKKKRKLSNRIISNNNNNNNNNNNISSYDNASRAPLPGRSINNNPLFNVHIMKPQKYSETFTKKVQEEKYEKKEKFENIFLDNNKKSIENKSNDNIIEQKKINLNKIQEQSHQNLNDHEMNNLEYDMALAYDKRTFFQYYLSLLKKKQLILFTFVPINDYNLMYIKIILFIMSFSLFFTINGFFFSDKTMHKVYEDYGSYDFLYQIPQIFYSTMVCAVINIILKQLSLSEKNILEIKGEPLENIDQKSTKIKDCLKIKYALFFILSFLLMAFFWYFISCFCAVYPNTQIILIEDTLISFITSMIYPFGLNLLPPMFRIPALRAKKKDKN